MVNTALTVNLCSTVTKEARKLIKLATINVQILSGKKASPHCQTENVKSVDTYKNKKNFKSKTCSYSRGIVSHQQEVQPTLVTHGPG